MKAFVNMFGGTLGILLALVLFNQASTAYHEMQMQRVDACLAAADSAYERPHKAGMSESDLINYLNGAVQEKNTELDAARAKCMKM